jgi:cytochrome c peroxidase
LPQTRKLDRIQVELGRKLFFDVRLSHNNSLSCAHCHAIENYGVDGLRVSVGINGAQGKVNAPSVLNCGNNFRQFWDGRAATLEDQVGGPLTNPLEMGSQWPEVIKKLSTDRQLASLSAQAYGRPVDESVIRSAVAQFERSLTTPNAPFDRYLRGDQQALTPQALAGWHLFKEIGCVSCHQGMNVGGNMYAKLGVMGDYFKGRQLQLADYGLYNQTHQEADKFKFKVPSLRNVEKTAPYFHDGSVATLPQAVDVMAHVQLGLNLSKAQRDEIVAFLDALTGELPKVRP